MSEAENAPKPYVGLDHYKETDAPFFFGRRDDRDLLIENLRASRMTLLYGTSGVGKSSVLHAGVAHQLKSYMREYLEAYGTPEFAVVIFRDWRDDPLPGLMRSTRQAIAEAYRLESVEEPPDESDFVGAIEAWTRRYDIELLFILDQFEDYFFYHARETGDGSSAKEFAAGTFARELTRALTAPNLRAKFIISLRDDALSKFDRFKPHLPGVFNNLFRLQPLDGRAAREAIVEPLKEFSRRYAPPGAGETYFDIEPALVDEIIRHLQAATQSQQVGPGTAQPNAGGADGDAGRVRIEAPYLQLVMERLWEIEVKKGSNKLQLATLNEVKGLDNIIQEHVDKVLARFTPEQGVAAAAVIKYLVRPSGDKIAYLASDLAGQSELSKQHVDDVLAKLTDFRILRPVDPPPNRPDESRYEIYHDVLGKPLLNWHTRYTNRVRQLEGERKRQRRRSLIVLLLLLTVPSILTPIAFMQWREAKKANDKLDDTVKELTLANEVAQARLEQANELQADLDNVFGKLKSFLEQQAAKERNPNKRAEMENLLRDLEIYEARLRDNREGTPQGSSESVIEGGDLDARRWEKGSTIHIRFLGGDDATRQKVAEIASEWTNYANINFAFDGAADAPVRIAFEKLEGEWSFLGTDALNINPDQPTMNLGFTGPEFDDKDFRRSVLRQFGHMLGLVNEHQNPNAKIPWNMEAVYKQFPFSDKEWADRYVLTKYTGTYREFDPKSVMVAFPIPPSLLKDKTFPPILQVSSDLSEGDKKFIATLYPGRQGDRTTDVRIKLFQKTEAAKPAPAPPRSRALPVAAALLGLFANAQGVPAPAGGPQQAPPGDQIVKLAPEAVTVQAEAGAGEALAIFARNAGVETPRLDWTDAPGGTNSIPKADITAEWVSPPAKSAQVDLLTLRVKVATQARMENNVAYKGTILFIWPGQTKPQTMPFTLQDATAVGFNVAEEKVSVVMLTGQPDEFRLLISNTGRETIKKLSLSSAGLEAADTHRRADIGTPPPLVVDIAPGSEQLISFKLPQPAYAGTYTGRLDLIANDQARKSVPLTLTTRGPSPGGQRWVPFVLFCLVLGVGYWASTVLEGWFGLGGLQRAQSLVSLDDSRSALGKLLGELRAWGAAHPGLDLRRAELHLQGDAKDAADVLEGRRGRATVDELTKLSERCAATATAGQMLWRFVQDATANWSGDEKLKPVVAALDAVELPAKADGLDAYRASLAKVLKDNYETMDLGGMLGAPAPLGPAPRVSVEQVRVRIERMSLIHRVVVLVVVFSTAYATLYWNDLSFGTLLDYVGVFLWSLGLTKTGSDILTTAKSSYAKA